MSIRDRIGAGADIVDDDVNGRIVAAGDVGALARALLEIGANDARREAAAAASRGMAKRWGLAAGVRRWPAILSAVTP